MIDSLTIYTLSNCLQCTLTTRTLEAAGLPYTVVDLTCAEQCEGIILTKISTTQTALPTNTDAGRARSQKVADRLAGQRAHGQHGYTPTSTITAPGIDDVTIINTLTKEPTK